MGMCAMYNFCKYDPRPLHSTHELEYDDESPRSGSSSSSSSSDGSLMLGTSTAKRRNRSLDQQSALWKRTIPKGRRCEPLDFSGLILYDEHGNRLNEFPPSDQPSLGA